MGVLGLAIVVGLAGFARVLGIAREHGALHCPVLQEGRHVLRRGGAAVSGPGMTGLDWIDRAR